MLPSRFHRAIAALQAQAPVPSQCPLDATVIALQAADVLADALFEEGLPGNELKAESVLDRGDASADEAGDASETATDIIAAIRSAARRESKLHARDRRPLDLHDPTSCNG